MEKKIVERDCKETDWYIQLKLSSTTFKGNNNLESAQLVSGENLYFDKFSLSIPYPVFKDLMESEDFQNYLSKCKKQFEKQLANRNPTLSNGCTKPPTKKRKSQKNNYEDISSETEDDDSNDDDDDYDELESRHREEINGKKKKKRRKLDSEDEDEEANSKRIDEALEKNDNESSLSSNDERKTGKKHEKKYTASTGEAGTSSSYK